MHQVRRPQGDAISCTNHFLAPEMQGMVPLSGPGLPAEEILEDSRGRLANMAHFFASPQASEGDARHAQLLGLLRRPRTEGGLAQDVPPNRVTHFAYLLYPAERAMWISQGRPWASEFVRYTV
jgi:hypothetical protein